MNRIGLRQPASGVARSPAEAKRAADAIGFPLVIRPSYVLGGRAMEIIHDHASLDVYIHDAVHVSGESPVLIDSYLADAIEIDVDAISDGADVFVAGIMQHIEEAEIHSGDSGCSLPPHSLDAATLAELGRQTEVLALALGVVGLMNIQFAIKDDAVYVLEVNPRASRTVPFVAKATGVPVAKIAARIMTGEKLRHFDLKSAPDNAHVAVKEAVFPFARFPDVDVILGPEMKSTGEVMGIDSDFSRAFGQVAARRGQSASELRNRIHLGQGPRQGGRGRACRAFVGNGLRAYGDRGHEPFSCVGGTSGAARQQGARGSTPLRRRHHIGRDLFDYQYNRRWRNLSRTVIESGDPRSCTIYRIIRL